MKNLKTGLFVISLFVAAIVLSESACAMEKPGWFELYGYLPQFAQKRYDNDRYERERLVDWNTNAKPLNDNVTKYRTDFKALALGIRTDWLNKKLFYRDMRESLQELVSTYETIVQMVEEQVAKQEIITSRSQNRLAANIKLLKDLIASVKTKWLS